MNLQLHHVLSDMTGVTRLRTLDDILGGERDPAKLAQLRDPRVRSSEETIAQALTGHYRDEHLFTLRQALSCLAKDFPQRGGPRLLPLSAERILELVFQHIHTREAVRHGQVMAVAVEQRPGWRQRIEEMQLLPLVLELFSAFASHGLRGGLLSLAPAAARAQGGPQDLP